MKKILSLVDDEKPYQDLVRFAFDEKVELQGSIDIISFSNGSDLLEYLDEDNDASIILLDINMPGLNGLDVLKAIKAKKNLMSIPVIILSASTDPHDIKTAYARGANAYVSKPMRLQNIRDFVTSLCDFWLKFAILPDQQGDKR